MAEQIDCVVIGAGAVGLAVARALQLSGHETILLESELATGTGTSSRNSEVIHAGIYYTPGSLKAKFCVEGKQLLYEFCRSHGVGYRNCGKFIVATAADQVEVLEKIRVTARSNGVDDLRFMSREEILSKEPRLNCVTALESPSTGVVDSHGYMLALQGDFEAAGGMTALGSPVLGADCTGGGITLRVGGEEPMELRANIVVNSAGLHAAPLARRFHGLPLEKVPEFHYSKGNYYALSGRSPFSRLIYPVPVPGGLGVHLTLDLAGQARFGPDVERIDAVRDARDLNYDVDPARADAFYAEVRKYWSALPDGALHPAYCGIRPKLGSPSAPLSDFVISGPGEHGVPGLVNLFGIESPGLTASLAIAKYVLNVF
jgi:L-2-hydroxyglutarate oxidase LhgO